MQEEEKMRRDKTEETADISDICKHFGLHVHFFLIISTRGEQRRRWYRSAYQNKGLQQFLTASTVIASIPLPSVFLDVLTWRNDVMHFTM